ncbi:MAG: hypothetical protein SVR94_15715 [Pseudomonadota bacterium]|nr:hypothetical protein [Pseudomonadota bacterium]
MLAVGLQVTTLTPFAYHSLMVQNGSATLPELISDHAIAFGLAATLGWLRASVVLPPKAYRTHLSAMPYRASVFTTAQPRLLPPLIRRLNLDGEAGFKRKIQDIAKKGNLKDFYQIQEIPQGQVFTGALFGFDPFAYAQEIVKQQVDKLTLRVGLHRNGMVLLERCKEVKQVRLNVATAALFERTLPVERYCLYGLQLSRIYTLEDAAVEVEQWQSP